MVIRCKKYSKTKWNRCSIDYINTYYDKNEAIKEAKFLSMNEDVLEVSVHKWILLEDGTQEHSEDNDCIPYSYQNKDHREWK